MNRSSNRVKDQFKYYVFLSVLYAVLMVTAQAVAYRMIELGPFLEPGGIFVFPATFAVSDVIAEVYGPTLARHSIYIALFAQAFFSLVPIGVNALPHPVAWHHIDAYRFVFGASWLVFLSNLVAVLVGMVLNTQLIGRTKLITQGKFFSLRSLLSSAVGEWVLTMIIVLIALVPIEGIKQGGHLFVDMFLFKLVFSFVAVFPASVLVVALKKWDNADVYEETVSLNPLSQFLKRRRPPSHNVLHLFSADSMGYCVELLSNAPAGLKRKVLYLAWDKSDSSLLYQCIGPQGVGKKKGVITWSALKLTEAQKPQQGSLDELNAIKVAILAVTSKRGHTHR